MGNGNSKWNNSIGSDARLNAMTHLSGTTSERTAMTDWPTEMPFYDTDLKKWYKNSGTQLSPSSAEIGAEGSAYDICYKLSTTIGDYTLTPASATATSTASVTASYSDDFSGADSWVDNDSAKIGVNTTNDNLDINCVSDGSNDASVYDLGAGNVSDTAWVLRFKINFSSITSGAAEPSWWIGLSSLDQTYAARSTSHDFIGMRMYQATSGTKYYASQDNDGTGMGDTGQDTTQAWTASTSTDYYFEIVRLTATTYIVRRYSDSTYTTVSDSASGTCASTIQSLRYIKIINDTSSGAGSQVLTLDNIAFYNNVTFTNYPASNTYDGSTSSYWKSTSEASPAIYWDFTSNRKFIGFAINLHTSVTTVTSMELSLSTDTTFSGEVKRTLLVSDFTNNTWRYILINIQQTDTRYVQLKGVGTGILSVYEFKGRATTDTSPGFDHFHRVISTTSTSASSNDSN